MASSTPKDERRRGIRRPLDRTRSEPQFGSSAIMAELDPRKYDVHPILITKSGAWIVLPGPDAPPEDGEEVLFSGTPSGKPLRYAAKDAHLAVDVFFPIIHGTFGEDGTLAGYVRTGGGSVRGFGVRLLRSHDGQGRSQGGAARGGASRSARAHAVSRDVGDGAARPSQQEAASKIGYPLFVKPSSSGSSVGVHLVERPDELRRRGRRRLPVR